MNRKHFQQPSFHGARAQGGVALVVGLLLLLVLTILGVTAIRNSTQQERMAAATQQQMQAFEAAESAIALVMTQMPGTPNASTTANIDSSSNILTTDLLSQAITNGIKNPASTPPTAFTNALTPVVTVVAKTGGQTQAAANLYYTGTNNALVTGSSLGKFNAYGFEIYAVAQQTASGAQSNNLQTVTYIGPKQTGN